jgi:hypothetical protein
MIKAKPSVTIYGELIKKERELNIKVINSRMESFRSVIISIVFLSDYNTSHQKTYKHSWEDNEKFNMKEILESILEDKREFDLKNKMDEALD